MASLVVALVAVVVAMAAWLRPMPQNSPPPSEAAYSDEQVADAKADVCEAYKAVDRAVVTNTHRPNPVEGDEIGSLAAAANGRLSLYTGGDYLLDRLKAAPAAPTDLAQVVRAFGNTLKKLGIMFTAEEPDFVVEPLKHAVNTNSAAIERLCQ